MAETEKILQLDERGRAALRQHGGQPGALYVLDVRPDGSFVLTPATVIRHSSAERDQI